MSEGTAAKGQLNLKTTDLPARLPQFLSLTYILLRLSSLFSRYSKLVSTSKILLHHVLVHKNKG